MKPPESEPGFPWKYLFKEVGPLTLARKRREGLCKHHGCRNAARNGRRDCETCHGRKFNLANPERYAFRMVKASARKRNIPFTLTFEQFLSFDRQTGYCGSKGRESESLTIDRIDSSKGYEVGNIRVLTYKQNVSKCLEGMTDPVEPIAKAMAMIAKVANWRQFKKLAVEVLHQVETLQAQAEGGFEPEDETCPF